MVRNTVVRAYLWGFVLNAPLFSLYGLLPFILCKDLKASGLQITALITIKPVVAILSTYWSAAVAGRSDRLKRNIGWGIFFGLLPSLFFPMVAGLGNWVYILGFAAYFFAERAIIPAWMEALKITVERSAMSRTVSQGSLVAFVAAAIFPVLVGPWLDANIAVWRWLFVGAAFLASTRILLLLYWFSVPGRRELRRETSLLLRPWKNCVGLLRRRPDFAWYQLVFFFGGLGIMVTQPALPRFVDTFLHLSYTELALAFALCKGVGFVFANPFWSRWIHRVNLYYFSSAVTIAAAISLSLILLSPYHSLLIYGAFLVYGVMQAGSQLSWQMGGPIFSGDEDSSSYTSVNVLLVGVRGCIGPVAGGLICSALGLKIPYILGSLLCLVGAGCGLVGSRLQHRGTVAQDQNVSPDPLL